MDGTRYEKIRTDAYSTSVSKPKVKFGYDQKIRFEGGDYQYSKTVFAGNTYKDDLYTPKELKITNKDYVIEVYYDLVRSPKVHIMNQDKEKQSPLSGGSFLIEGVRINGIYDYDDDYTGAFDEAKDFKDPSFNREIIINNNRGYYGKFPCGLYRITQLKAAEGYMLPKEPFYFGIFLAGKYTTGTANYNLNDDDNFDDEYQAFRFVKNENGGFQQEPIEWDDTDRAFPFIIENTRMVSDTIYNYYRKDSESGPIKGAKFILYKKKEQVGVSPVSPDREEGGFDKEEPTALKEELEKAKAELQSLEEEQKVQGENVDTAHSTVTEEKGQGGELVVPESKSTDDSSEPLQNVENVEIKEESINSSVNPLQAEELPSNQEKNEIESTADGETPTVSLSDKEETGASVTHSSDELGQELPADENQVSKALDDSKEKIMQLKEKIKKLEIQSLNDKSQSTEESTDSGEAEEEYNKIGEFTTDENGLILNKEGELLSLDEGAYYLIQTDVPTDFQKGKLKLRVNKFFFQIGADGRMTLPYDSGIETVATTENSVEEKTGYIIYNTLEVPEVEEPKPDLPKEQPEPPKEEEPVPSVFIEPLPLPNPIEDPSEKIEEDPAPLSEPNDEPQTAIEDEDVILEDDEETVIEDTEPVPLENLEEELDMEEIPLSDIPKTSDRRLGIFYIPVLIMAALLLRSVEKIKKQDE